MDLDDQPIKDFTFDFDLNIHPSNMTSLDTIFLDFLVPIENNQLATIDSQSSSSRSVNSIPSSWYGKGSTMSSPSLDIEFSYPLSLDDNKSTLMNSPATSSNSYTELMPFKSEYVTPRKRQVTGRTKRRIKQPKYSHNEVVQKSSNNIQWQPSEDHISPTGEVPGFVPGFDPIIQQSQCISKRSLQNLMGIQSTGIDLLHPPLKMNMESHTSQSRLTNRNIKSAMKENVSQNVTSMTPMGQFDHRLMNTNHPYSKTMTPVTPSLLMNSNQQDHLKPMPFPSFEFSKSSEDMLSMVEFSSQFMSGSSAAIDRINSKKQKSSVLTSQSLPGSPLSSGVSISERPMPMYSMPQSSISMPHLPYVQGNDMKRTVSQRKSSKFLKRRSMSQDFEPGGLSTPFLGSRLTDMGLKPLPVQKPTKSAASHITEPDIPMSSKEERIHEGNHKPLCLDMNFPDARSFKRSTHKEAEQRRRDELKSWFEALRKVIPSQAFFISGNEIGMEQDGENDGDLEERTNEKQSRKKNVLPSASGPKNWSKLECLQYTYEYVVHMQEELRQKNARIEKLERKISSKGEFLEKVKF